MIREESDGLVILIKVIPNSSKNQIVGWENDELKIKIKAPPEDGKANKELIAFLAKRWSIAKSDIHILQGESNRHKKIKINNLLLKDFHL